MNFKSLSLSIALLSLSACSPNLAKNDRAVLGGEDAPANSLVAKSTVSLGIKMDDSYESFCTGTIVSKNLILTATHCLEQFDGDYSEVVIYFGNNLEKYNSELERTIDQGRINEDYSIVLDSEEEMITALNDVALLKINGVIPATNKPVSIIDENLKLKDETTLTLAGWGILDDNIGNSPTVLQYVDVSLKKYWATHLITDQTADKGACSGDSGGPAFIRQNDQLIVVGATRGPHLPALDCRTYGEYTNLSVNKSFIVETANSLGAEEPTFANVILAESHAFDKTPPTDYDNELITDEVRKEMAGELESENEDLRQNETIDESDITVPNEYSDDNAFTQDESDIISKPTSTSQESDDIKKSDSEDMKHISVTGIF